MKHLSVDEVMRVADGIGVSLTPEAAAGIAAHAIWLLQTNRVLNLTSITDPRDVLRLHVADSLAAYPELQDAPAGPLLDLGTGGGYPGLPLALVSGRDTVLLDSVRKKSAALEAFLGREGLSTVQAVADRAELHAGDHRNEYAVVVARAVAPLPSLVELAAPLLMHGGRLLALKANPSPDEIEAGVRAARKSGMRVVSVRTLALPDGGEHRSIIVYEAYREPQTPLPRQVGRAQNRPLA